MSNKLGKERLLKIMNEMVSVEIAAVTEYQQHAYMSDDPYLIDILEDFSIDEMEHIEWCSREVTRLGGLPTVKPMEIKECRHESKAFLERDIEIESLAIARLKEFIKIAEEEGDNRIKKLLEEILADEETHHDKLKSMLNPPTSFKEKLNENMDIGAGLILTGLFWLSLWLFPFYPAFISDPRWAHNFAYPLILITIGIAYKGKKMSSDIFAAISAFMIIPTETGMISGMLSTKISIVLLAAVISLIVVEKSRKQELLFFQHRWRRWLKKHLITFAFLFLLHMPFIYWFTRVMFGEPAEVNLPPEPPSDPTHWGTALYNILVMPFGLIGMAERLRGRLRRKIYFSKLGYWWSLMIIISGIAVLGITSGAWMIFGIPMVLAVIVLIISIIAFKG